LLLERLSLTPRFSEVSNANRKFPNRFSGFPRPREKPLKRLASYHAQNTLPKRGVNQNTWMRAHEKTNSQTSRALKGQVSRLHVFIPGS
jgi:hypothetical protein